MNNKSATDSIATDLKDIPQNMSTIRHEFRGKPDSLNRQSLRCFVNLIDRYALNVKQTGQRSTFRDVLLIGEEKSLNTGEFFVRLLKIALPLLNVEARSSNDVLHDLNHDESRLNLGPDSLVIAVTQSLETYSTKNCIDIFNNLCKQKTIREVFTITASLINAASRSEVYQNSTTQQDSHTLRHNLFDNCSERYGERRIAEPATITVMSSTQVLTEMFLGVLRHPNSKHLGMDFTQEEIDYLERSCDKFIDNIASQIVGANLSGEKINSKVNKTLINNGRKLAQNVLETPTAWAIHSAYIATTVALTGPPIKTTLDLIINNTFLSEISGNLGLSLLLHILKHDAILGDTAIYILGSWLWTLILRYSQRRQILARTGTRTLIIVDVPWVNALIESYLSKMAANSYGVTSIEVHGVSPNDAGHKFLHRTTRGKNIFLGIPDGRGNLELKDLEDAVIVSGRHISGVQHLSTGAEIIAIGVNPEIEKKGFSKAIALPEMYQNPHVNDPNVSDRIKLLEECLCGERIRLLAFYVLFHALMKEVASFPLLKYKIWKTQSGSLVMTTASPVIRRRPSYIDSSDSEEERQQD